MKGSEAVELLRDILDEASGHIAEEINPEWLLKRIEEKLGMLPPETDNIADAEIVISPAYFQEHVPQQFILGWDKE
jgi:hypothetical protein